jgi:hypothetical protein
MASPSAAQSYSSEDAIWHHLKQAIATSSGFQRWRVDRSVADAPDSTLEQLVSRYLRETLETLAY